MKTFLIQEFISLEKKNKKTQSLFGLKKEKVQDDMSFLASPLSSPIKRLATNNGRTRSSPKVDYKSFLSSTASSTQRIPSLNNKPPQPGDGKKGEETQSANTNVNNTNRREEFSNSRQESLANFVPVEVEQDDRPWRISGKKPSISRHIESAKTEATIGADDESTGDISGLNHLASLVEMEKKWG